MTNSTGMTAILRRAWLLAGTLAVIAGLLGMHVLTAGHASHAAASHAAPVHQPDVNGTVPCKPAQFHHLPEGPP